MVVWYKSKQFWFNILSLTVAIAAGFGFDEFDADPNVILFSQLGIALINIALRFAFPSKPTPSPAHKSAAYHDLTQPYYTRTNQLAVFWTAIATGTALILGLAITLP